jgi:tetratricopeptide (TPR) repeat protein
MAAFAYGDPIPHSLDLKTVLEEFEFRATHSIIEEWFSAARLGESKQIEAHRAIIFPNLQARWIWLVEVWPSTTNRQKCATYLREMINVINDYNLKLLTQTDKECLFPAILEACQELSDPLTESVCLNHQGLAYWDLGEYDTAIDCCQKSLALAESLPSKRNMAIACHSLASLLISRGQVSQSLHYLRRCFELVQDLDDETCRRGLIVNMVTVIHQLGDYPTALELGREALRLARQSGDQWSEINAIGNLGTVLLDMGETSQAEAFFQDWAGLALELQDQVSLGKARNMLGGIAYHRGDWDKATKALFEAEQLFLMMQDVIGVARVNGNLALIAFQQKQYENALQFTIRQEEWANRASDVESQIHAAEMRGLIAQDMQDYDSAETWFQTQFTLAEQHQHLGNQILAKTHLADLACQRQEFSRGISAYHEALNLATQAQSKLLVTSIVGRIAAAYLNDNAIQECEYFVREHVRLASETEQYAELGMAYSNMAVVYAKKSMVAEAREAATRSLEYLRDGNPHRAQEVERLLQQLDELDQNSAPLTSLE